MGLFSIAEMAVETVYYGARGAYTIGYWILYGTPKTNTEKLLEKQNNTIRMLHEDLKEIREKLDAIEQKEEHIIQNKVSCYPHEVESLLEGDDKTIGTISDCQSLSPDTR